jgi:hypothetical protein
MEYQEVAMDPTVLVTIAAGDSHPIIDFDYTVVVQLVLFLILFLVANKLLFQPYLRLREKRQAGIEGARHEAERMSAEADSSRRPAPAPTTSSAPSAPRPRPTSAR